MSNIYAQTLLDAMESLINAQTAQLDTMALVKIEDYDYQTQEYLVNYKDQLRYSCLALDNKRYSVGDEVYILLPKGENNNNRVIIGKVSEAVQTSENAFGIKSFVESFKITEENPEENICLPINNQDRIEYNNGLYPFSYIVLRVNPFTNYIAGEGKSYKMGAILHLKTEIKKGIDKIALTISNKEMFGHTNKFIGDGFEQIKIFSIYWIDEEAIRIIKENPDLEEETKESRILEIKNNPKYIDINNIETIEWFKITEGLEPEECSLKSASLSFGYAQSDIGENALLLNYDGEIKDGVFSVAEWSEPETDPDTGKVDKVRKIGYNKNNSEAIQRMSLEWVHGKTIFNELHPMPKIVIDRDAIVAEYCQKLIDKEKELNKDNDETNNIIRTTIELEDTINAINNSTSLNDTEKKEQIQNAYNEFWNSSLYSTSKEILALQKSYTAKYYENYYFYWCKYDNTIAATPMEELLETQIENIISDYKQEHNRYPTFNEVNSIKTELLAQKLDIKSAGDKWHTEKVACYIKEDNKENEDAYVFETELNLQWIDNQYKVLILDQDGKIKYISNPAYFYQEGKNPVDFTKSTNLKFLINDNGYNGTYNIYGNDDKANNLPTNTYIGLEFNTVVTSKVSSVEWRISKYNSMIEKTNSDKWTEKNNYYIYTEQISDISEAKFPYQIRKQLISQYTENTIECTVYLDNGTTDINDSITLKFGNTNAHGTGWTLNIVPYESGPTITPKQDLTLKFELYNPQGVLVENYAGLKSIKWTWFNYGKGFDDSNPISQYTKYFKMTSFDDSTQELGQEYVEEGTSNTKTRTELTSSIVNLSLKSNSLDLTENYCIVQLKVDIGDYTIGTLWPVVVNNSNNTYISASVPGRIVYDQFNIAPTLDGGKALYLINNEGNPCLTTPVPEATSPTIEGVEKVSITVNKENNIIVGYQINFPNTFITEQKCNISFRDSAGAIVWSQPIIITSNTFGFEAMNKWSGDKVQISETEILTPMLFVGEKNAENKNTYLALGSLSTGQKGMYGYHNGENTFAIKSDGSFYFGKGGNEGQIRFDIGANTSELNINVSKFNLNAINGTSKLLINSTPINSNDHIFCFQTGSGANFVDIIRFNKDGSAKFSNWNLSNKGLWSESIYHKTELGQVNASAGFAAVAAPVESWNADKFILWFGYTKTVIAGNETYDWIPIPEYNMENLSGTKTYITQNGRFKGWDFSFCSNHSNLELARLWHGAETSGSSQTNGSFNIINSRGNLIIKLNDGFKTQNLNSNTDNYTADQGIKLEYNLQTPLSGDEYTSKIMSQLLLNKNMIKILNYNSNVEGSSSYGNYFIIQGKMVNIGTQEEGKWVQGQFVTDAGIEICSRKECIYLDAFDIYVKLAAYGMNTYKSLTEFLQG